MIHGKEEEACAVLRTRELCGPRLPIGKPLECAARIDRTRQVRRERDRQVSRQAHRHAATPRQSKTPAFKRQRIPAVSSSQVSLRPTVCDRATNVLPTDRVNLSQISPARLCRH